ncbi:amidohydrolase family protein [Pseudonocardia yuanmonensis]|uniref:amidohydrolase family protein n=1 Tax=Pseudonocardia yuanmonensis TaxID=1095914 RepID=UPI0031EAC0D3
MDTAPVRSRGVDPTATLAREGGHDSRLLIKGGSVVSMDDSVGDLGRGDVLIVGDTIAAVAERIDAPGAVVIDARDHIVIPGFCDPHIHCWEGALGRLLPTNIPQTSIDAVEGAPRESRSYMYAAHRLLGPACRPEDVYAGTLVTLLTALEGGITTVVDNMHNARSPEHSDAAIAAMADAGVRGTHAVGRPRHGAWAHTFPQDVKRLRERHFSSDDQLCDLRLYAAGNDDLDDLLRLRKDLDLWFSFDSGIEHQPLDRLYSTGWFDGREAINHANHLTLEQRQTIVDGGSQVNVCPRIETQFRYGVVPYSEWVELGLRPGISNDNPMTYGIDMFSEMRALYLVQRLDEHRSGVPSASLRDILRSATQKGADNCGRGETVGSLTPGKQADVVLLDTQKLQLTPRNNVICSIVQAADIGCVDTVLVAGRVVKSGGRLVGVDHGRVRRLVEESQQYLLGAVGWPHELVDFDD